MLLHSLSAKAYATLKPLVVNNPSKLIAGFDKFSNRQAPFVLTTRANSATCSPIKSLSNWNCANTVLVALSMILAVELPTLPKCNPCTSALLIEAENTNSSLFVGKSFRVIVINSSSTPIAFEPSRMSPLCTTAPVGWFKLL